MQLISRILDNNTVGIVYILFVSTVGAEIQDELEIKNGGTSILSTSVRT